MMLRLTCAAAAALVAHAAPSDEQWRLLNSTSKQQCAYGTPNNGCPKGQHCWSGSCRCDCAAGPKAPCTLPPCAAPTSGGALPCDVFAKGGTPCVAAHSMTRALYATYAGPLYSLKKGSSTTDIKVVSAGGVVDGAAHAAFCGAEGACILEKIYDQSPLQNHLGIEHGAPNLGPPRNEQDVGVNFTDAGSKTTLGGKPAYAAFFVGDNSHGKTYVGQGYSNRTAKGTAVGDEPQTSYALFSGKHYNDGCCFDCEPDPEPADISRRRRASRTPSHPRTQTTAQHATLHSSRVAPGPMARACSVAHRCLTSQTATRRTLRLTARQTSWRTGRWKLSTLGAAVRMMHMDVHSHPLTCTHRSQAGLSSAQILFWSARREFCARRCVRQTGRCG